MTMAIDYTIGISGGSWVVYRNQVPISWHALNADADAQVRRYEARDRLGLALDGLKSMSADIEDGRTLKLHFDREVTDETRQALLGAVNAYRRVGI